MSSHPTSTFVRYESRQKMRCRRPFFLPGGAIARERRAMTGDDHKRERPVDCSIPSGRTGGVPSGNARGAVAARVMRRCSAREEPLAVLRGAVASGRPCLVRGEAGIGKTVLVQEATDRHRATSRCRARNPGAERRSVPSVAARGHRPSDCRRAGRRRRGRAVATRWPRSS